MSREPKDENYNAERDETEDKTKKEKGRCSVNEQASSSHRDFSSVNTVQRPDLEGEGRGRRCRRGLCTNAEAVAFP